MLLYPLGGKELGIAIYPDAKFERFRIHAHPLDDTGFYFPVFSVVLLLLLY